MNVAGIVICLSILFCTVDAQAQIHSPQHLQDTIPVVVEDSTLLQAADSVITNTENSKEGVEKKDSLRIKTEVSLELTSDKFFAPAHIFSPSPRKAVIYSAILPGLGQIYNRKYWKLPILYGGVAGLAYAITWNNGYYQYYLGGYKDIKDEDPTTNRWHKMLPYGQDPETADIPRITDVLQRQKDRYRYYRDLSIIITFGVYLIAIVDAYVDAQLFDFDMSPDLSMRMTPVIIREERSHKLGSSSYGVQLSFNF